MNEIMMQVDLHSAEWNMMLNHVWHQCGTLGLPMPNLRKESAGVTAFLFDDVNEKALKKFKLVFPLVSLRGILKKRASHQTKRYIRCRNIEEARLIARAMEGEVTEKGRLFAASEIALV
jgi:hypothetical protein